MRSARPGSKEIIAGCTHALLSEPAYERIENSEIAKVVVTDTIPLKRSSERIDVVSVAELFSDAIRRIYTEDSVSTLFAD